MTISELLLAELEREVPRSRRALEATPANKRDWKPHEKSMDFGYLADMVATMPQWVAMIVKQDQHDIAPKDGPSQRPAPSQTGAEFVAALEQAASAARAALGGADDAFLRTPWKLLAGGQVVLELPRHVMIADTLNHWAHHRGQMTVYLRLMGARVPALYGPSADDRSFGP